MLVGSALVSSMTSRSPRGTWTLAGSKRMSTASTCTVVVLPVGTTSPAAVPAAPFAPAAVVVPDSPARPAAAGSRPMPTETASASAVRPATSWPPDQIEGR